jgi:hypothetical protein
MRKLYRFDEAAERFYGGDRETLRHALLLGVVRARVELCGTGHWAWWSDESDDESAPDSGETDLARWKRLRNGAYSLTGWFYLSRRDASRVAHGLPQSWRLLAVSEDDEEFLGLLFRVHRGVTLSDLWFEPSEYPDRERALEDEALDHMADGVHALTDDVSTITAFQAAAAVGADGLSVTTLLELQQKYSRLQTNALVLAATKAARAPQAKGGRAKAAKNEPIRAQVLDAWAKQDKRGRGVKTAFVTRHAGKHRVSTRTIENWLKGHS